MRRDGRGEGVGQAELAGLVDDAARDGRARDDGKVVHPLRARLELEPPAPAVTDTSPAPAVRSLSTGCRMSSGAIHCPFLTLTGRPVRPAAINMSVKKAAESLITKGVEIKEGLLNTIEMAYRAYDPCMACATH